MRRRVVSDREVSLLETACMKYMQADAEVRELEGELELAEIRRKQAFRELNAIRRDVLTIPYEEDQSCIVRSNLSETLSGTRNSPTQRFTRELSNS